MNPRDLIQKVIDGSADHAESAELYRLLIERPEVADEYVEFNLLEARLLRHFGQEALASRLPSYFKEFADQVETQNPPAAESTVQTGEDDSLAALAQAISGGDSGNPAQAGAARRTPSPRQLNAKRSTRRIGWIFGLAAVIAVGVVGIWLGFRSTSNGIDLLGGQVTVNGKPLSNVADGAQFEVVGAKPAVIGLSDGSRLELEPATVASVHVSQGNSTGQSVDLVEGQGRFSVAHQHASFRVTTAVGDVSALGTGFSVQLLSVNPMGPADQSATGLHARSPTAAMAVAVTAGTVQINVAGQTSKLTVGQSQFYPAPGNTGVLVPANSRTDAANVRPLRVAFYDFDERLPKGIDSLDDAKAFVARSRPNIEYTLALNNISCPQGQDRSINAWKITLGDYLLGPSEFAARKAAGKASDPGLWDRMSQPVNYRSVFVFDGFISVTKAGAYDITAIVDDGDEITIGGVVVHSKSEFGGMTNLTDPRYAARAIFAEPGIYPIQALHWDRENELGIHVYANLGPGGEVMEGHKLMSIMTSARH